MATAAPLALLLRAAISPRDAAPPALNAKQEAPASSAAPSPVRPAHARLRRKVVPLFFVPWRLHRRSRACAGGATAKREVRRVRFSRGKPPLPALGEEPTPQLWFLRRQAVWRHIRCGVRAKKARPGQGRVYPTMHRGGGAWRQGGGRVPQCTAGRGGGMAAGPPGAGPARLWVERLRPQSRLGGVVGCPRDVGTRAVPAPQAGGREGGPRVGQRPR